MKKRCLTLALETEWRGKKRKAQGKLKKKLPDLHWKADQTRPEAEQKRKKKHRRRVLGACQRGLFCLHSG